MNHLLEAVQEVRRDGEQRTFFVACSCGAWPAGVLRACIRPLDSGHQHNGELCWSMRENADGSLTFKPSANLEGAGHFHTALEWTIALTEGRALH